MEQPEVASNPQTPIDSVSIHDHSSIKKSRGGKPKLFQCTGYGDCRMVFTRSEHLARHMRKHTGEKPFKCVVPGCNRMFSRFDNMMQHTQTHNKARSTSRGPKNGGGKSKDKRSSENSLSDADSCYDQSGLPSPPPSRRGTKEKSRIRQQRQLQRKNYAENYDDDDMDDDNEMDDDMDELEYDDSDDDTAFHSGRQNYSDDSDSDASYSMYGYHGDYMDGRNAIAEQRAMFAEMRRSSYDGYTLPPPVPNPYQHPSLTWSNPSVHMSKSMIDNDSIWSLPSIQAPIPLAPSSSSSHHRNHLNQRHSESPMSFSSASATTDSTHTPCKRQRTAPKVQFHPYPHRRHSTTADGRHVLRPLYQKEGGRDEHNQGDDTHMILPRIATYLMAHPDEPPENYLLHHHYQQQSPLYQKRAMTWPTLPGTEKVITRRLSVQDLCNPIECLEQSSVAVKENNTSNKDEASKDVKDAGEDTVPVKQEEGVDLTLDEYEAIQGFGRFQKCGTLK